MVRSMKQYKVELIQFILFSNVSKNTCSRFFLPGFDLKKINYMVHIKDNSPTPLFRCWIFFRSRCFLDPLFKTKVHETLGMHYSGMIGHQYEKKLTKLSFFDPFFDTSIWGVWDFPWFLKNWQFSSWNRGMNKMTKN